MKAKPIAEWEVVAIMLAMCMVASMAGVPPAKVTILALPLLIYFFVRELSISMVVLAASALAANIPPAKVLSCVVPMLFFVGAPTVHQWWQSQERFPVSRLMRDGRKYWSMWDY